MRIQSFTQLSEKLLSPRKRIHSILGSGIDNNSKNASTLKPKTLNELCATHHVPGKFHKYFELDAQAIENNSLSKLKRKRQQSVGNQAKQEGFEGTKDSKKQSKINEIIFNLLEESAHLSNAMKKDKWEITTIQHVPTKAIVYYKIDEKMAQGNQNEVEKKELIELITHFQPAFQKAFNAQFLKFNKWSANRNEMPKILLKNDECLSRAELLNALLDKIDLEQQQKKD